MAASGKYRMGLSHGEGTIAYLSATDTTGCRHWLTASQRYSQSHTCPDSNTMSRCGRVTFSWIAVFLYLSTSIMSFA